MRVLLACFVVVVGGVGCAHRAPDRVVMSPSRAEVYERIELEGAFEVSIAVGPKAEVELVGSEEAVQRVRIEAHGNALTVTMRDRRPFEGRVKVRITTPRVETIEVNGATELHLSGFDGGSLMLEINGVVATHARGSLDELVLELNGAGSVDAVDLIARRVDVELSGAGSADVHATEELRAELNGVGSVRYAGGPKSVERELGGLGTISALGAR